MSEYFETFVGNTPLLTFRLQRNGARWDVSAGYTIALEGEPDDGVGEDLDAITCSSDEEGADWALGLITVRVPATYTVAEQRIRLALTVTRTAVPEVPAHDEVPEVPALDELVNTEDDAVLLVQHRPGYTPPE